MQVCHGWALSCCGATFSGSCPSASPIFQWEIRQQLRAPWLLCLLSRSRLRCSSLLSLDSFWSMLEAIEIEAANLKCFKMPLILYIGSLYRFYILVDLNLSIADLNVLLKNSFE